MKNIAILIGVSDYKNKSNDLPMCENDVEAIHRIVLASQKYEIVEVIKGNVNSSQLRNRIIEIEKNIDEDVGELFFYFSGHGYVLKNHFYFCTSDTDLNDINSTAIEHEQIDDIVRRINPRLYVKVVDACYSSTQYIKEFDYKTKSINNCYFLFSSRSIEQSIADNDMSFFTKYFIEAIIKNNKEKSIKYIDIVNYLADQFTRERQTPEFITQGDMLDEFVEYNDSVKKVLEDLKNEHAKKNEPEDTIITISMEELINEKIRKIASQDEYRRVMELIDENIRNVKINGEELRKAFNLNVYSNKDIDNIPDKEIIANWIFENKEKCNLFANTNIGQLRKILAYNLGRALEKINGRNETENVEKITITETEFPFHYIIEYIPKKIGIEKYGIELIIISSPYKIYLFFSKEIFSLVSWSDYELKESTQWEKYEIEIRENENISELIESYIKDFEKYIVKAISEYLKNLNI